MIDGIKPNGMIVEHSFQTNGTLIDDAWCTFFIEQRVDVGVSIDRTAAFARSPPPQRSGRGTYDRAIAGVRLLQRRQAPFHVISVLTTESLAAPQEMLNYYVAEGIEAVCLPMSGIRGRPSCRVLCG